MKSWRTAVPEPTCDDQDFKILVNKPWSNQNTSLHQSLILPTSTKIDGYLHFLDATKNSFQHNNWIVCFIERQLIVIPHCQRRERDNRKNSTMDCFIKWFIIMIDTVKSGTGFGRAFLSSSTISTTFLCTVFLQQIYNNRWQQ